MTLYHMYVCVGRTVYIVFGSICIFSHPLGGPGTYTLHIRGAPIEEFFKEFLHIKGERSEILTVLYLDK